MWCSKNRHYFQWDIYNPSLPRRKMEAMFYHEADPVTLWKVTLEPMGRGVNYWQYSFSLEFAEHTQIEAEEILIFINLNGDKVADKRETNRLFCVVNWFVYHFNETIVMHPQTEPHLLIIRIDMALERRYTGRREVGNGLFFNKQDLKWLSLDMRKLLDSKKYCNMNLLSSDSPELIPAHSYIVATRWNNFFTEHSFDANGPNNTVQTDISYALLLDILVYMYSGQLRINFRDADYIAELFHVIDRYKLHHLYKALLKNKLQHKWVTRNSSIISCYRFPLAFFHGRPANRHFGMWRVNAGTEHEFIFRILVSSENRAGYWLSYSVESRCLFSAFAQVNLEVVKKVEDSFRRVGSFDGRDCTMDPGETMESGPVLFLGCPETFGDSPGTESEYDIRCFLNVADGEAIEWKLIVDDTQQDESERFRVLSDHMHILQQQKTHSDMTIYTEPHYPGDDVIEEHIHKGILEARLPRWWRGFEDTDEADSIPDRAKPLLFRDPVPSVLDYMYTGKIFNLCYFTPDVLLFAILTMFESFQSFWKRIPYPYRN